MYEIAWARLLGYVFGTTVFAVSAVLASYMAGLAGGSWFFGRVSDKQDDPVSLYGWLQAGIAISAFIVPFLFTGLEKTCVLIYRLYNPPFYIFSIIKFVLSFAVLLVPSALMGGTLPVINRYFVNNNDNSGLSAGRLYSVNTLGAVAGCVFAGFYSIGKAGIRETIYIACALNLAVAVTVLLVKRSAESPAEKTPPEGIKTGNETSIKNDKSILYLIALSGFTALAYELLWTRGLIFFITNTTYAFTIILVTFLAGIAAGSRYCIKFLKNRNAYGVFGVTEVLIGIFSFLSIFVFGRIDTVVDRAWLMAGKSWWGFIGGGFASTMLVMFVPAFLFGMTFPLCVSIYGGGISKAGTETGAVYAANTAGSIFGSLAAGFLLVPALGIIKSIMAVALLNIIIGGAALLRQPFPGKKISRRAVTAVFLLMPAVIFAGSIIIAKNKPVIKSSWGFKNLKEKDALLYCKEGITGSVAVVRGPRDVKMLSVDGQYTAYASIEDLQIHVLLGYLPYLLVNDPKNALVIGFGMGVTAGCLCQPGTQKVFCVEIAAEETGCAQYFREFNNDVLRNPLLELIIEDGRNYILSTQKKFDIISSNAVHVRQSPSLYTKEFYGLCRDRLSDNGIMCQWMPTNWLTEDEFRGLAASFNAVFPDCLMWYVSPAHVILTGNKNARKIDFKSFMLKVCLEKPQKDLSAVCLEDPYKLLSLLLMDANGIREYSQGAKLHTDNHPYAEFGKIVSPACSFVIPDENFRVNTASIISNLEENGNNIPGLKENVSKCAAAARHVIAADALYWSGNPQGALEEYAIALGINPKDRYTRHFISILNPYRGQ